MVLRCVISSIWQSNQQDEIVWCHTLMKADRTLSRISGGTAESPWWHQNHYTMWVLFFKFGAGRELQEAQFKYCRTHCTCKCWCNVCIAWDLFSVCSTLVHRYHHAKQSLQSSCAWWNLFSHLSHTSSLGCKHSWCRFLSLTENIYLPTSRHPNIYKRWTRVSMWSFAWNNLQCLFAGNQFCAHTSATEIP